MLPTVDAVAVVAIDLQHQRNEAPIRLVWPQEDGMIRVRLKVVLAHHGISTDQFAKTVAGVSLGTIAAVHAGRMTPSLTAVDHILTALRELTGQPLQPGDLLEYVPEPEALTAEDREWLDADLSRLGEIEPYEWGPEGPPAGLPIRYEPGVGFVVEGEKRYES